MSSARPTAGHARVRGFTLIELLVATMAFAVLLVALHTVLFAALRLRSEAQDRTETSLLRQQVCRLLRADLRNGLLTGGLLANTLQAQAENQSIGQAYRLDLTTTTGHVSSQEPWGDVQLVSYYLTEPLRTTTSQGSQGRAGLMLVRSVQRNLLSLVEEEPEPEPLLDHVLGFTVSFYDGQSWLSSWQTTDEEAATPQAIRVRIEFVPDEEHPWRSEPIELLVPWSVSPPPSSEASDQGATGSGPDASSQPPGAGSGPANLNPIGGPPGPGGGP